MVEDDAPRQGRNYAIGQKLDEMSVADFDEAIQQLKAEILRLEAARSRKAGDLAAAQALFSRK